MNKVIEDYLSPLDEWTLYIQENDSMPWITFKKGSPLENILIQANCFDDGDLENYEEEGSMVFSSSQIKAITEFMKRIAIGNISYQGIEFWHELINLVDEN